MSSEIENFKELLNELVTVRRAPKIDLKKDEFIVKELKELVTQDPELPRQALQQIGDEAMLQDPLFLKGLEALRKGNFVSARPADNFGKED